MDNILQKSRINKNIKIIGITFFFAHMVSAVSFAYIYKYPSAIDEHAHYSYVLQMKQNILVLPGVTESKLFDHNGRKTSQNNYLNHPPFYYFIMSLLANGDDQYETILTLRLANAFLSSVSVLILLYAGAKLFSDTPWTYVVFAGVLVFCPLIGAIGGLINNDNLGLLGSSIAFLGLSRFPGRSAFTTTLLGIGFILAALSKLNAGLAVGILILVALIRRPYQLSRSDIFVLGVCMIVGTAPYLLTIAHIGAPLARIGEKYLQPDSTAPITILEFVLVVIRRFINSWPVFPPATNLEAFGLLAILLSFVIYCLYFGRNSVVSTYGLAMLIILPIHAYYLYENLNYNGIATGMSFRYYLPVWPGISYGVACLANEILFAKRRIVILIILPLLFYGSTAGSLIRKLFLE